MSDGDTDSDWQNSTKSPARPRGTSYSVGGLHHRHKQNHQLQQTPEQARASRQSLAEQYKERARRRGSRPRPRYAKRIPVGRWIRSCLIAGIPAYIVAAIFFARQMTQRRALYRSLAQLGYESSQKRYERPGKDQQEELAYWEYRRHLEGRAEERRARHQPNRDTDEKYLFSYDILMSDQYERDMIGGKKHKLQYGNEPAGMENLCGILAKKASWEYDNTQSYIERDALNKGARVVITGILNPVGFQLALALKEHCGVQVITGLDAMFPNTIESRLNLSEQIMMLHRNIPKLVKPILPTYVGGDPQRLPRKTMKTLESTGELDFSSLHATHIIHLAAATPEVFRNDVDPEWKNLGSPYVEEDYDPAFYQIRSSLTYMEQILSSIATMDPDDRPHFVYASASPVPNQGPTHKLDQWHGSLRLIDELLADHYHNFHGVYSVGLRLPNNIYGPWSHPDSQVHRLMQQTIGMYNASTVLTRADQLDLLHIDDVTDALVASMQYRNPSQQPTLFDISSGGTVEASELESVITNLHTQDQQSSEKLSIPEEAIHLERRVRLLTRAHLAWEGPRVPLHEGLIRTLAWHLDRANPYGPPIANQTLQSGDSLLENHSLSTCQADDLMCHRGRTQLACASGCSSKTQCVPSLFDSLVELTQEVTEGCGIVLYTQELGREVSDLRLHSEYMDDGDPLICNFAFVSRESPLVESVMKKVPDTELKKLGVHPNFAYEDKPHEFHEHKLDKLNGRLLFRGWILLWPDETPATIPEWESSLIKLTPGALFSKDVKHALFIDQSFNVSPSISDIQFLVGEMHRQAWPSRLVKRKQRPKAKFLLPPEPERRAVLLLSELKYQDSSQSDRLPSDTTISVFEATRFMRFELGEEPIGKEPTEIKNQRDFYERLSSVINREYLRSSTEPVHKYQLNHWARTRWVLHDLELEESRQLRCDWYQEHVDWGTQLDQLSFAFIMAKRELKRKIVNGEPDESIQKAINEKTEMKKLLSDTFEWHALLTEQNVEYSPYEEMKMLPYEIDFVPPDDASTIDPSKPVPLFARIISDRLMAYARKTWNDEKALEEVKQEIREKKAEQEKAKAEKAESSAESDKGTADKPHSQDAEP